MNINKIYKALEYAGELYELFTQDIEAYPHTNSAEISISEEEIDGIEIARNVVLIMEGFSPFNNTPKDIVIKLRNNPQGREEIHVRATVISH